MPRRGPVTHPAVPAGHVQPRPAVAHGRGAGLRGVAGRARDPEQLADAPLDALRARVAGRAQLCAAQLRAREARHGPRCGVLC